MYFKKIVCIVLSIVFTTVLIWSGCFLINNYVISQNINSCLEQGYIKLNDGYENSIYDFFNQSNSIDIMKSAYSYLTNESTINYHIIDNQILNFEGDFYNKLNNINFVLLSNKESINQEINNEFITPIKSIQIDYNTMKDMKVNTSLFNGCFFEEETTINDDNTIPIIVGYNYQGILNINDNFNAYYLGEKKNFKVIGILNRGFTTNNTYLEVLNNAQEDNNLDNYIIIPNLIDLFPYDDSNFNQIVCYQNCNGYLFVNSIDEFNTAINYINRIINKTSFKYNIDIFVPIYKQCNLDYCLILISFFLSIILLLFMVIQNFHIKKIEFEKADSWSKYILYIINYFINTLFYVGVIYTLAYLININILLNGVNSQLKSIIVYISILYILFYTILFIIEFLILILPKLLKGRKFTIKININNKIGN